jgi:CubicO group peptidase (beta-lactamase class C family)
VAAGIDEQVGRVVPGLSVVVADADKVLSEHCAGVADLATGAEMTASSSCNWFSMTKLVTATAVVQLAERGLLDLDAPVGEVYEPFTEMRPAARAGRVTTRHLLSHAAGVANPMPLRWVHLASEPGPEPAPFAVRQLQKHPRLRAEAGTRASYSNVGYLVLGEIVARVSGMSYTDYVRANVLAPLGMTRTDFTAPAEDEWATPYQRRRSALGVLLPVFVPRTIIGKKQGGFVALRHFLVDGPAYGGLVGPPSDAIRFARAHLRDGELDGVRILSARSCREMRTIVARGRRLEVGLGWFRRGAAPSTDHVEHLGGGAGFWSCLRLVPPIERAVVVMGNATSYDHGAVIAAALADVS